MHNGISKQFVNGLVSIIMPAYNSSGTISESIQSVLNRTYWHWELWVVDDCSKDELQSIVNSFKDKRIYYYRLKTNLGVAQARNKGIELSNGQYLAFLDSDDLWHPKKLAEQIAFMQSNHYAFTYTWYQQFSGDITNLGNLVRTKPFVDYHKLLKGNDIGCLTVIIDRNQINDVHMPMQRHEDYITWLNILKSGQKAYSLPKVLAYYREEKTSMTGNKWKSMMWTWNVYRKSQCLSVVASSYYMLFYILAGLRKHF